MITKREKEVMAAMVRREIGGCEQCIKDLPLIPHHIQRRSAGGKDIPRNLQFTCAECHKVYHYREEGLKK